MVNPSKTKEQRFWDRWEAAGAVRYTPKRGCMPNTDFRYEEFEGLLGSFHLSLLPLRESINPEDKKDYQTAMQVLNGFAQRYNVQSPEDAVKNPRARESWGNAQQMSNFSMLDMTNSFWADFGIGAKPNTPDQEERLILTRTIMRVLERYGVVRLDYDEHQGKRYPAVRPNGWNKEKCHKTLADVA